MLQFISSDRSAQYDEGFEKGRQRAERACPYDTMIEALAWRTGYRHGLLVSLGMQGETLH